MILSEKNLRSISKSLQHPPVQWKLQKRAYTLSCDNLHAQFSRISLAYYYYYFSPNENRHNFSPISYNFTYIPTD